MLHGVCLRVGLAAVRRRKLSVLPFAIGTSTLMAAWNAAVYVAQIDDRRLAAVMGGPRYLEATREVLQKHGKLWFLNESYVIWRNRFER